MWALIERSLVKKGKRCLTGYLVNYFRCRIALAMVRPLRTDDIGDSDAVAYNPQLSRITGRRKFWEIHWYTTPNVARLLARCNEQWSAAGVSGAFVAGDEAIAPHKRKGPMRMFIPRKPHVTGVKLYVLADCTTSYVVDMHMYHRNCRI